MTLKKQAMEFQNAILRSVEQHIAPYVVDLRRKTFTMFPETFNPIYAKAALLLIDNLGVKNGDYVLDPFTGCGADAIFSVLKGAEKAVAIDKFEMPYLCARYNVNRFGLEYKIDVRRGDLFEPLKENEKFDLVVANPPFKNMNPHSNIAAALRDEEYKTLIRFFREVGDYLKPDGRIRIVFSDVGDMKYFHSLAKECGFSSKVVAEDKFATDIRIEVYEMKR